MDIFKSIYKNYIGMDPVKRSEVIFVLTIYNCIATFLHIFIDAWVFVILSISVLILLWHASKLSKTYFKKKDKDIQKKIKKFYKELN